MKNQDILKKLTAKALSQEPANTSFLMLPLRLETKFMERMVEVIYEPERIFYTLRKAWYLLCIMRTNYDESSQKQVVKMIEDMHVEVEKLDVLYPHDKTILINILNWMKDLLPNKAEIRTDWTALINKVERLESINAMQYNRAEDLLNRLEHYTRLLINTCKYPPFDGKKRRSNVSNYSQSAIYKAGFKHFKQCRKFIQALPEELKKVPWMTAPQIKKFYAFLDKWDDNLTLSEKYQLYSLKINNEGKVSKGNVLKSVRIAKGYFDQEWAKLQKELYSSDKVDSLASTITEKATVPNRYTRAVGLIFDMVVTAQKNGHKKIDQTALNELKTILENTVFDYGIQRDFMRKELIKWINYYYSANIDYKLLNNYNKFIYKKKMLYEKRKKCLCVRIYPDELAVTQAIRPLSENEYLSGRDFWLKYSFYTNDDTRKSLWLAICDLYPAYRAAWIVRKTFPSAYFTQLETEAKKHGTFEEFEKRVIENNSSFSNAFPKTCVNDNQEVFDMPTTALLPDRFILQAVLRNYHYKRTKSIGTTKVCKYGHRLPETIQVGLNLNNLENTIDKAKFNGYIFLNGSLRWMTDYDEAERMGMAITLPLDQFAYERLTMEDLKKIVGGKKKVVRQQKNKQHRPRSFFFESLYVFGINNKATNSNEKTLTDLLEAHLYSKDGYSLLNIGTATNILTEEDRKANAERFDTSKEALIERYKHQPENCIQPSKLSPDEEQLKKLFALNNSVLGNIEDTNNTGKYCDIVNSRKANAALIEKVDNKIVELFKNNDILKGFLSNDVLARGPFPPIRIGSQPYGILPICDFRNLMFDKRKEGSLRILKEILIYLTEKWNYIAENRVSYCDEYDTITADDYLRIAGSTPVSSYFQQVQTVKEKNIIDKPVLLNPDFFKFTDPEGHTEKEQLEVIEKILSLLGNPISVKDITPYLNGFDDIPIIEDDSQHKYHQNFSNLELPNLVKHLKDKKLAKSDEEAKNYIIEFFDLFAYRLDAWMMGLLSNKLRKRIAAKQHNITLGSYGWVFNLKEYNYEKEVQKEPGEYILAPSVNQAITGAVLRSSYKNSRVNNNTDYTYSVNLSSERVRNAIRIIEGVQNGLAIGTILGTDLERLMHDEYKKSGLDLNEGIYELRKKYLLVESENKPQDNIKDNDITVVNGAKLLEDYRKAGSSLNFVKDLDVFSNDKNNKEQALWNLIDRIDDEYDALTDVVLSEGVYKLTQGQREAVDALMQALDTGKNIPMPEVAEIPITSAQVDGSLVVALNPKTDAEKDDPLLARIEPKVESWVKETLGTDKVKLYFQNGNTYSEPKNMQDLGVSASEMVYLSANKSAFLKYLELKNWLKGGIYESFTKDIESDGSMTFDEMELMLDNMRELLAGARILRNDDLVKETGLPDGAEYKPLKDTYDKALERVQELTKDISDLLDWQKTKQDPNKENYDTTAIDDEKMREKALQLAAQCFSIGQTTAMDAICKELLVGKNTLYGDGDSKAFLETVKAQHIFFEKMNTICENLKEALNEAEQIVNNATEKTYRTYTEAIQKLLVSNMLIVPTFVPDANVPIEMLDKQKSPDYFKNVTSSTVDENIQSLSKVSPQMMRFHQLRLFQKWNDLFEIKLIQNPFIVKADIVPMQIPIIGDKPVWLGTEVQSEEYVGDAFTYMVVQPKNFPSHEKEPMAGIVLDHWIERIPYREQTAGLAFNFDQPDTEAPQALLLAVATKDKGNRYWSQEMLLSTLRSTMHLVKCRSVEPDDLREYAWTAGLFPLINYTDNTSSNSQK